MIHILVKHKVKDYDRFREVFFDNLKKIKNNGSQGGYIFRDKDDPTQVWVLIKWDTLENFNKFAKLSPADSLERGGVIGKPEGWFFQEAEEF